MIHLYIYITSSCLQLYVSARHHTKPIRRWCARGTELAKTHQHAGDEPFLNRCQTAGLILQTGHQLSSPSQVTSWIEFLHGTSRGPTPTSSTMDATRDPDAKPYAASGHGAPKPGPQTVNGRSVVEWSAHYSRVTRTRGFNQWRRHPKSLTPHLRIQAWQKHAPTSPNSLNVAYKNTALALSTTLKLRGFQRFFQH